MIRGQRVELDLGSDDEQDSPQRAQLLGAFVGDVLERKPAAAKPPSAPTLKSKTGFPEHRKHDIGSRFKQQKSQGASAKRPGFEATPAQQNVPQPAAVNAPIVGGNAKPRSWEEEEKQRIDEENSQKLAGMSQTEIEEEQRELMSSLSPALIQRLLKRSNIESGSNESNLFPESQSPRTQQPEVTKKTTTKSVSFAEPQTEERATDDAVEHDDQEAPVAEHLPHDSVHFPGPPQPPDLDPSSATFLDDLHDKYFPSLPADPDKLEWMQASKSNKDPYDPTASAFSAKEIRFSFNGELLAPKTASLIPVTAGLHHHGDAPDSAGYTIAELAHLSRSTYAAQRCIAFQTLGRILYRLGKGEFGDPGEPGADLHGAEDTFGELARGLWNEVAQEKVIETLVTESEGQGIDRGKHVSAKAYATEGVWLWRKGGGRRWKAA